MALVKKAKECADHIKEHTSALVVSHIDADGLTAAAIMKKALKRRGMDSRVIFVKQLDQKNLQEIADQNPELIIFTDLGSGMLDAIKSLKLNAVIADHHQPQGSYEYHLNPHIFGFNGGIEVSGSGMTYFIAREMGDNGDLAALAIVGAVGDLQHSKHGQLIGLNRTILEEGVKNKVIHYGKDLMLFGRQTRPVFKL